MQTVKDIRIQLATKLKNSDFVIDKSGSKTIEVIGATFLANEDYIFKQPNEDYIERELAWYKSQSLYVKDIPGKTPTIWEQVSSNSGKINSNYGWCVWSEKNYHQFANVVKELKSNPNSRRATMIYNRPSMHYDYNENGMSDFMCTYANTFLIRDNKLVSHYIMRSNDLVFGFNNDVAWAKYIHKELANELGLEVGDLIWTVSNAHVYERHFSFVEDWANTNLYR
jgi:thymidylate synthase